MILVAGATGSLGQKIVRGLLDRGQTVRALARPTSDHAFLRELGASVTFGDVKDRESLDEACRDVEAVITTVSASKRGDDTIENVDLQGNQHLIAAAESAGVRHFVFASTIAATADSPVPTFRAKAAAEERLRNGSMHYTILQANAYMDVWFPMLVEGPMFSGQAVTLVGESRRRHAFVAEQDVAEFAMASLVEPAARNATIVIGGPEALTFRDVVRAYEEAAGGPIRVRTVLPGEPIPGVPEPVWGIAALLETFDSVIPMEETAALYGVTLTNVVEFARSRVASAPADRAAAI